MGVAPLDIIMPQIPPEGEPIPVLLWSPILGWERGNRVQLLYPRFWILQELLSNPAHPISNQRDSSKIPHTFPFNYWLQGFWLPCTTAALL